MRIIRCDIFLSCFFLLTIGSNNPALASDPLLKDIRFKKISENQERVLFTLNGSYLPEVCGLKGENPRVVCDFFALQLGDTVRTLIDTGGSFIQFIRVGIHESNPPKIRVVLDLAPNQDYDVKQDFFQRDNIFIISVGVGDGDQTKPIVKEIRFKKISENEEKVLFVLNGVFPPEVFDLKEEKPRVVCDFFDTQLGDAVNRLIDTNGDFIQRVRVGIHETSNSKIRVVLDLVPNKQYDIQQVFFQNDNIFVIIIHSGDE